MTASHPRLLALVAVVALLTVPGLTWARREWQSCHHRVRTDAGWVCGAARWADAGAIYASFRGVPYAKQPLGELRFKELQPAEPWNNLYDATEEGPACYQTDVVYGRIIQPQGFSEACIHANVHVPLEALPGGTQRLARELQPPYHAGLFGRQEDVIDADERRGLPILVFVHGGGFQGGSGDADLHGPEYLVTKGVIVITFNYRLNIFGFLSLNTPEVPGNQGLRDIVTLLRWVQRNALAFGGDPNNVTLMGQSAGAISVHLLTLSQAAEGLFKRAILMSGTGISSLYSPSPLFAQKASKLLVAALGINSTDPEYIYRQLVEMPVEKLHEANKYLLDQFGLTTFLPTIETEFPGVTRILDDAPQTLLAKGRGQHIPLIIGFTNAECETFRPRFDQIDIASRIIDSPMLSVPLSVIFTTPPDSVMDIAKKIDQRYYGTNVTTDGFIKFCTDSYYTYPALKLAEQLSLGGAPVFLYQFSYTGEHSVLKEALGLSFRGAGHIEDLTYVFRVNSMLGTYNSFPPEQKDDYMKLWMTTFITDFMQCSAPVCEDRAAWPAVKPGRLQYQDIQEPSVYRLGHLTHEHRNIINFFDNLRDV